jgi:prophage antirepressor-like protein
MNDTKTAENPVTPFAFEGLEVRTLERDGVPWFVAKDVCDILGLGNAREAIRNFPENERFAVSTTDGKNIGFDHATAGVNLINEPGLYRLIFQSRKPEAEAFKTWVFTEVLPSIRKKGYYRYEKEIALRSLPPLKSPQEGEYRYKFFNLAYAPEILDWISSKAADGLLTRAEVLSIISSTSEKDAWKKTKDHIANVFIKENIILTNHVGDYMVIEKAYELYRRNALHGEDCISRHAFTRKIRKHFEYGILEWIKRVDGKPTRVFVSCKLKEVING